MESSTSVFVDTKEIINTKDIVSRKTEEFKYKYEEIYELTENLIGNGDWSGTEARKYYSQIQAFRDDFDDIYNSLITYRNFLAKTADAYEATLNNVKATASKLAGNR